MTEDTPFARGLLSTEFWSMIALQVVNLLVLTGVIHATDVQQDGFVKAGSALAMAVVYVIYTVTRGRVKVAQAAVVSAEVASGAIPPEAAT
jgi:hypothetical protein